MSESISRKCRNPIAVSAIAHLTLRPNFRALGPAWSRGTHDRRSALQPDRLLVGVDLSQPASNVVSIQGSSGESGAVGYAGATLGAQGSDKERITA